MYIPQEESVEAEILVTSSFVELTARTSTESLVQTVTGKVTVVTSAVLESVLGTTTEGRVEVQGFSTENQDSTGTAIHIGRVFDLQNWMFPSVKAEQDILGDVGGNNDEGLEWLKNLVGSALDDKWFVLVCVLVFLWFVVSLVRILGKIETKFKLPSYFSFHYSWKRWFYENTRFGWPCIN